MAKQKKKRNRKLPRPVGQPTKYRKEYPDLLIEHMEKGGSFTSFAAIADVSRYTIYEWARIYPEFLDAKDRGEMKALKFFEDTGKAGMVGSLRRVSKENLDDEGNVASREYAQAKFNDKVWSLTQKNRFRWTDRIELSGEVKTGPKKVEDMTKDELDKELRKLRQEEHKRDFDE